MRDWLRRGAAAARLASDRSDLWLAGALGWLVYVGWLPLLIAVAPAPQADDVAFLGVRLVAASAFPWNVVALVAAVIGLFLLLILLAAVAEVGLRAPFSRRPTDTGAALVLATMAIILVAALPVAAAGLALTLGIVTVAPGLFLATPSLLEIIGRTVTALWPLIAVLALFLLLAQTFGAVAIHAPVAGARVAPRLGHAARDVLRNPARRLATAAASMLADLATLIVSVALLRVLWAPIGADLGGGRLLTPATLALLLGFVTIWLGLVLGAGAIRTWLAAWWSLEIGSDNRGDAVDAS